MIDVDHVRAGQAIVHPGLISEGEAAARRILAWEATDLQLERSYHTHERAITRPLQHLHITPHGKCVLCCEDYDEKYEVGDLNESTIEEVLTGDRIATLRRWVYGLEESPADFICKGCIFALTR